jgi:hypothetical protein
MKRNLRSARMSDSLQMGINFAAFVTEPETTWQLLLPDRALPARRIQ